MMPPALPAVPITDLVGIVALQPAGLADNGGEPLGLEAQHKGGIIHGHGHGPVEGSGPQNFWE